MFQKIKYLFLIFVVIIGLFLAKIFFLDIPSLKVLNPHKTALMQAKGGPITQTWVEFDQIPYHLKRAIVLAEDSRFYEHGGVDYKALKLSFKKNVKKGKYVRGGSTITMQLAKNLYLTPKKALWRKGLEILMAIRMEQVLSKNRILEIYLNVIEWGPGIYGAKAAGQHYFRKSASELNPDESAFLAAIIPSPIKWGKRMSPGGPYIQKRTNRIARLLNLNPSVNKKEIEREIEEARKEEEKAEMMEDGAIPDELFY